MTTKQLTNRTSSSKATDQWYEINGDSYGHVGCHVSNDPPTENGNQNLRSLATLKTCNITQYMCTTSSNHSDGNNSSNSDNRVEAIEVIYEYEIYFNSEVNLTGSLLPYFEESMLENLATSTGIMQCLRQEARNRRRNRIQRSLNGNSTDSPWQGRFLGINKQPLDKVNTKYAKCKSESSPDLQMGIECVPILGGVTVFVQLTPEEMAANLTFTNNDRQTIRDTVSNFVREAMDGDVFVVPTTIEKVKYVGNSTLPMVPPDNNSSDISYSTSKSSSGRKIGLICGILSLIIFLVCCFCFGRRRRARKSRVVTDKSSAASTSLNEQNRSECMDAKNGVKGTSGGQQCLASLDSLALRGNNAHESLAKITESDNESSCDTSRSSTIESNSLNKVDKKETQLDILGGGDNEENEELDCQNVEEKMEEGQDGESIVAAMSDELDLLDQLALHGRPPPYPSLSNLIRDNMLILPPARSLSPTTISAASQSTMYTGPRKIVGSPTTCSQSTMRAGNLRYFSKNRKNVPVLSSATSRYSTGTISTAYTPDSFDAEILCAVTSDDSLDHPDQANGTKEPPPPRTFADVLDGHESYINDEDLMSYRSDNENTNAVQRHLQMS